MPPEPLLATSSTGSTRALLHSLEELRDTLSARVEQLSNAVERLRGQAGELERALAEDGGLAGFDAVINEPSVPAPVVPASSSRIADDQPASTRRSHDENRAPRSGPRYTSPNPAGPSHTSPSAITSELAALRRSITPAEIHALLDRASQPLASTHDTSASDIDGMELVHQRLLDRLRVIREESNSPWALRRRAVREGEAASVPALVSVAIIGSWPNQHRSRGLPPTNIGSNLHQPEPTVVRSSPASPASTVMLEPTTSPPPERPNTAGSRPDANVHVQQTSSAPVSESGRPPLLSAFHNLTDVFDTAHHEPLNPTEALSMAFADGPPLWHRPNARAHNRDRDPSLTYRGMTVAARLGENTSTGRDTDETSFLSSFPFLSELYESPPPADISPRTQPLRVDGSDAMSNLTQLMVDSNRRSRNQRNAAQENSSSPRLAHHAAHDAVSVEQGAGERARQSEARRIVEAARGLAGGLRQEYVTNVQTLLGTQAMGMATATRPHETGSGIGSTGPQRPRAASPLDEEISRMQRDEAERLRSLAQDIVRSRPGQTTEVDTPLAARQLEARESIERSRARMRDLAGLRRDLAEVRAEAPQSSQETVVVVEQSRPSSESETVFEGAGERREGVVGDRTETAVQPGPTGDATYSEHKDHHDFAAHLWPAPVRTRHRERVYISLIDL